MQSSLDPRVAQAMVQLVSAPPIACDIALRIFFPELFVEFQDHHRIQGGRSMTEVYDWLQTRFPRAPIRLDTDTDPDKMFREMLKHIIAKALNIEYTSDVKLIQH